ncbi:hypothetical protein O181_100872 [Austropuccinia psidii MF-1]|uniref:Uncharacterized protein n=1 Tax=Austropuccinia psidii MF-1 TaxID=1389203 RepID=A0A9Q3PHY4_9BASI|nr:hypothetical protein [Austropuccinia psidii MF-1]
MLPQIHHRVMNSWYILKKLLKEEEIVRYSNGWNPLSSKPQIKKDKGVPLQKEGGKQGRSPSSFYQKASSQTTSPRREEKHKSNWGKPYSASYRIPKLQKKMPWTMFSTWPEP